MNRSTTSPFRGTGGRGSRDNAPQSLELLIKSLERENNTLVEEINSLKAKNRMVTELQDKINLVLKHNTQLLTQNEKLAKLINQKKSQVQVWKNKHETLSLNRVASNELQNRKLINEIQKLKEEITQVEHIKNMQISELKNQNHLQIQNIKRLGLSTNEKYELEIRKLKEIIDKKQYDIGELNMRINRINKQTDYQINKLREQKDRIKNELIYEQKQHKKQIDSIKNKFQFNLQSQINSLKQQNFNQIQTLDYQNSKLKDVIKSKNNQIQQILSKNLKVKSNYQDSIDLLKKQTEDLKQKLIQTQHLNKLQLNNLRDKLQSINQSQLSLLKDSHTNQLDLLNREINKLQQIIDSRNKELQNLAKQRNQMRLTLQAEALKAKTLFQTQLIQNKDLKANHQEAMKISDYDLKCKNQEMKTIQAYLNNQINILKNQRDIINNLLDQANQELDRQRKQATSLQNTLKTELQASNDKQNNLADELQRVNLKANGDLNDLKKINQLKTRQLNSKIASLEDQCAERENLIAQLKDRNKTKEEEVKTAEGKLNMLQQCQKDLRKQLKDNFLRWQAKEDQYNALLKEQIAKNESTRKKELSELNGIHENKIKSLKHQIRELERHIDEKNNQLSKLKEQYEHLVNKFEEVFAQKAAEKKLDIKIPGWLPDTLSTKALFDVFLKNKVLDYCS